MNYKIKSRDDTFVLLCSVSIYLETGHASQQTS